MRLGVSYPPDQHHNTMTMPATPNIDDQRRVDIESAVYRKMIEHCREGSGVEKIDLMNLAYFCRNCLSKWYRGAAAERGVAMDYDQAREIVYGMPYAEYKSKHGQEASAEQLQRFETARHKATE